MSKDLTQQKALIFRIVHRDNIPWILDHGLHCKSSNTRDPNYVDIGNLDLISKRDKHPVRPQPNGTLSDYVPFYFTPFSPMMYNIKTGWGGIRKRDNHEIVIMVSSLHRLTERSVPFLFTDRHAYLVAAQFYSDVTQLDQIDWDTPARALVAELVRRYWILGIECSLLEVQKLAYFLERSIQKLGSENPLDLRFQADKYGPYATRLTHLLDGLDGSYLHCGKRLGDAGPFDIIWFEDSKRDQVATYLGSGDAKKFLPALEATAELIDGFESPLGMELLATLDWLIHKDGIKADREAIKVALKTWTGGEKSAERKLKLFEDRLIDLALDRLGPFTVKAE